MPKQYPNRKSPRLKGFDYSSEGWYFVTICTKDRVHYFGEVVHGHMHLSDMGQVVHDYWQSIPEHFAHVILGEMVVMPNHVHGLIGLFYSSSSAAAAVRTLQCNVRTAAAADGDAAKDNRDKHKHLSRISPKSGSLSHIIRTYKASCTHTIRQITDKPFGWHGRYYDHIVRNQADLQRIENYIQNNPEAWSQDRFFGKKA